MEQRHGRSLFYVSVASVVFVICFAIASISYSKSGDDGVGLNKQAENLKRLNAEIAYRLRGIPNTLILSRSYTNATPKANVLSGVFALAEADWPPALLPEFNKRSVISLCYDLKALSKGDDKKAVEAAYEVFQKMAKAAREKYYVHVMYKMSVERLKQAEEEGEGYYKELVQLRPQWETH